MPGHSRSRSSSRDAGAAAVDDEEGQDQAALTAAGLGLGLDVKQNSLTGANINEAALNGVGGGGTPSGPAGGDLAGNYPKPQIAPGAVGPSALAAGAVGPSKLGKVIEVRKYVQGGSFGVAACSAGSHFSPAARYRSAAR